MPRPQKSPVVFVALSPAMLATAFQIAPRNIYAAIEAGHLRVCHLPGTVARRIWLGDAEKWFREHWLSAKPIKSRRV